MKLINRRALIKSLLSSTILLSTISESTNIHSDTNEHPVYADTHSELIKAYMAWQKTYTQTPGEYLNSKNLIDRREMSYQCRNDFISGNTLEIEGLVLSKTETAIMLELYFG